MTTENTIYKVWLLARKRRTISKNHIFHSDRGIQYASNTMKLIFNKNIKITQSMSRTAKHIMSSLISDRNIRIKGNCWDNAVAESFFKTLKYECVYRYKFSSFLQAHFIIKRYIKWYNTKRLHSALGYKTPLEVEQQLINNIKVA